MMSFKIGQAGTTVERKRHVVLLNPLVFLSCSSSLEFFLSIFWLLSPLPSSPRPGEQHLCAGQSMHGWPKHSPLYGRGCYPPSVTAAGDLLPVRQASQWVPVLWKQRRPPKWASSSPATLGRAFSSLPPENLADTFGFRMVNSGLVAVTYVKYKRRRGVLVNALDALGTIWKKAHKIPQVSAKGQSYFCVPWLEVRTSYVLWQRWVSNSKRLYWSSVSDAEDICLR